MLVVITVSCSDNSHTVGSGQGVVVSLRLKDLLGPVTRVKQKKTKKSSQGLSPHQAAGGGEKGQGEEAGGARPPRGPKAHPQTLRE